MMKRAFLLIIVAMVVYSCGPQTQQQAEATIETTEISQLVTEPMTFENQTVRFEGTISHICRHSGDKMRIVQKSDDSYSILVMLGDMSSQFNPEMEGQEIALLGTMRAEVKNMDALEEAHDHEGHGHEEGHECSSTELAIQKLTEKGISPDLNLYVDLLEVVVK